MKFFCVCFGMMIGMLGIWVEVGTAQTITATDMPDANLRGGVLEELKASGVLPNSATTFTRDNMAHADFDSFFARSDRIGDLTGLEYATSLTELRVHNGGLSNTTIKISDISVLAKLPQLTYLSLLGNNISDISALSGLTSLTELRLSKNNISNISAVSGLTALTELTLSRNNISNISAVSGLTALTRLDLSENNISDISAVSGLTSLTYLSLPYNKISTTDAIVGLTNLEYLHLHGHRITDVGEFQKLRPLSMLTVLTLGSSYGNNLTTWKSNINNPDGLQQFLWVRPSAIDAGQAVSFGDYPEDPPPQTFPFTIRFSEPVYGFQMDDIIVETELDAGTGAATLEALTPTTEPEQTYIATIRLPTNAAGTVRIIVRAEAAEAEDGRYHRKLPSIFHNPTKQ